MMLIVFFVVGWLAGGWSPTFIVRLVSAFISFRGSVPLVSIQAFTAVAQFREAALLG